MPNLIAFSTLACPDWSTETVIARAAQFGYDGLEWRGGPQGHVQPAMPAAARSALRQASDDAGLSALAVTAYTSFVSEDVRDRQANVDDLKRYVDLAADLGARYVRAFLGQAAERREISHYYDRIVDSLAAAAGHARSVGVVVAVEPHDDFVLSSSVAPILKRVAGPGLGVIWDVGNSFAAGEAPDAAFQLLSPHLAYVQVKDGRGRGPPWQLTSIGGGQVPLPRALDLLLSSGYAGAFSVEWERAWHPELDPPEVALPDALRRLREWLAAAHAGSASAQPMDKRS